MRDVRLREILIASTCGILVFLAVTFGYGLSKKQQTENIQHAEENSRSANSSPKTSVPGNDVLPPGGEGEASEHKHKANEEGTEFWPIFGARLKITDTIIATFTALLFWATLTLSGYTRELVRDAKVSSQIQNRGYIFINSFEEHANVFTDVNGLKYIKEWFIQCKFTNTGITPASDVSLFMLHKEVPFNEAEPPNFEWGSLRPNPIIIGPHVALQSAPYPIQTAAMTALWERKIKICLAARIEYKDVFNKKVIHHHEMRVVLGLYRDPAIVETGPDAEKNIPRISMQGYGQDTFA